MRVRAGETQGASRTAGQVAEAVLQAAGPDERARGRCGLAAGLALLVGLAGAGCSNDDIVVSISGLDPEVRSLQVSASVDGQSLGPAQTVARTLQQFVVNLPPGTSGTVDLTVAAMVSPECQLAEGKAQLSFASGSLRPTVVEVGLSALPALWCRLPGVDLRAVWGSSPTDVWVAGAGTPMLHWDDSGSGWQAVAATPGPYNDLWGSGPDNIFAVGPPGGFERWNGSSWSRTTLAGTPELVSVFGMGPSDVWFVGDGGTALRWNGSSSTATNTSVATRLSAVWGVASNDVWAAGINGVMLHWTGSAWTRTLPSPSFGLPILSLSGSGASDVWGFGGNGVLPHYNGSTWSGGGNGLPSLSSGYDLWAASLNEVWGVGSAASVVRWDGGRWNAVPVPSGVSGTALKLWGVGRFIWVVVQGGTLLRFPR